VLQEDKNPEISFMEKCAHKEVISLGGSASTDLPNSWW